MKCSDPRCPGDHSETEKLSSCTAMGLWDIQMNGGVDESTGNSDWHYAVDLFTFSEEWEYELSDGNRWVTFNRGVYLLFYYSSGAIEWRYYPSAGDGYEVFADIAAEWIAADWD